MVQQGNVKVAPIIFESSDTQGGSGQPGGSNAISPSGGAQTVNLVYNTTVEGDFDEFVPIKGDGLMPGNTSTTVQRLNTYVSNTTLGNATAYLVPNEGLTFVSVADQREPDQSADTPDLGH